MAHQGLPGAPPSPQLNICWGACVDRPDRDPKKQTALRKPWDRRGSRVCGGGSRSRRFFKLSGLRMWNSTDVVPVQTDDVTRSSTRSCCFIPILTNQSGTGQLFPPKLLGRIATILNDSHGDGVKNEEAKHNRGRPCG